jgi:hypothetical protein
METDVCRPFEEVEIEGIIRSVDVHVACVS